MTLAGRNIELVGIGGCGMSGLARVLHAEASRSQAQTKSPAQSQALEQDGITVTTDQSAAGLKPEIDLVIATAAVPPYRFWRESFFSRA